MKAVILSVDTKIYQGAKEDNCAPVVKRILEQVGFQVEMDKAIPRDFDVVKAIAARVVEDHLADLILTIGGIDCYPEDCVPEATKAILERETPGIAESIRSFMTRTSKRAMLSRGAAGLRRKTLIINLPDSPKVIKDVLDFTLPEIVHVIEILLGEHQKD